MWQHIMGNSGQFSPNFTQPKKEFSLHHHLHNVALQPLPGKAFSNPNFVNKNHPSLHHLQANKFVDKNCYGDSFQPNFTSNSSQIIDKIAQIQPHFVAQPKEIKSEVEGDNSPKQVTSRKRSKQDRSRRKNVKSPGKNSKQNNNRQTINDLMEVDSMEMENSYVSDCCLEKHQPNVVLGDFLIPFDIVGENASENAVEILENPQNNENFDVSNIILMSPVLTNDCRQRQLSVCESEDSFIVFVDGTDDECDFSDNSESEESESDDDSEEEEDLDSSSSVVPNKRVRFAEDEDLCQVHPMVKWSFAYQAARKGPWEEYARDRERFKKRIWNLERVLNPIFAEKHRRKVYQERFYDDKAANEDDISM